MNFGIDTIPPRPNHIAIVTGANTGLGFETALELAKKSMKVVLACRSEQRANDAAAKIRSLVESADVKVMLVDLGSLASVRRFADQFRNRFSSLNLLINNAGIMHAAPRGKTEDGFEKILAANYLGHFVLTCELLDMLPDTPESRVVSLGSVAHKVGQINFDDIHLERRYSDSKAYAQSKLACLMFSDELQRRLAAGNRRILSVAAHPGGSITELIRNMSPLGRKLTQWFIAPTITHSVNAGAMPTLAAALSPEIQGGEYIGPINCLEFKGPPGYAKRARQAQDADASQRLFELSEQLTRTRCNL